MVSGLPDATRVCFDDERVVANAGILLSAVLARRLGIEALIDEAVVLGDRAWIVSRRRPGRSLSLVAVALVRSRYPPADKCDRASRVSPDPGDRPGRQDSYGQGGC